MSELEQAATALRDHPAVPATAVAVLQQRAEQLRRRRRVGVAGAALAIAALATAAAIGLAAGTADRSEPLLTGPTQITQTTVPSPTNNPSAPTTATNSTLGSVPSASLPGTLQTLRHVAPPSVPLPTAPCTAADLQASVLSMEPYPGMGHLSDIVTLTSTRPCFLKGQPTLRFGGPAQVTVSDNGITDAYIAPMAEVAVGDPRSPASFFIQYGNLTAKLPHHNHPVRRHRRIRTNHPGLARRSAHEPDRLPSLPPSPCLPIRTGKHRRQLRVPLATKPEPDPAQNRRSG